MTIESQLERICVALEALATIHAGPALHTQQTQKHQENPEAGTKKVDPTADTKKKVETKKVEPEAKAGKVDPEKPAEGSEVSNKTSFDDLADKVKALGRMNRDAVVTLFKQFGIERLGGLEEKDYIAFDIAIAKAITASKGE